MHKDFYNNNLKGITEAYSKSKSWEDVITSGYFNSDENTSMEAFIDLVEDVYKTKIKDAKQLDKLTRLTTLLSKEPNIENGKEPTLDYILTSSRYSKYFTTLEDMLEAGAKYKDILLVNPKDFNLPDQWEGTLAKNKDEVILWAISFTYLINEPAGLMMLPSLRTVADEIEAPYSVLMDCYKIFNGGKVTTTLKDKKVEIDNKIKDSLPLLMDEIGDKYYKIFDKGREYESLNKKDLKLFKEDVLEELKTEFCYTLSILILNEVKEKRDLDELRTVIGLDIVKYFSKELIDLKILINGTTTD